jgi:predicted DNA-binding ribbon-helix-helix protein
MASEETIRNSFQAEFAFWQSLRESHRARKIDLEELLLSWAINQIEKLESPGARDDFIELCIE